MLFKFVGSESTITTRKQSIKIKTLRSLNFFLTSLLVTEITKSTN